MEVILCWLRGACRFWCELYNYTDVFKRALEAMVCTGTCKCTKQHHASRHNPPPKQPLSTFRLLRMVVDNPIKAWPQAIYRQHLYRSRVFGHDTIYVMAPDLIRTVLLDEADNFKKGEIVRRALGPAL